MPRWCRLVRRDLNSFDRLRISGCHVPCDHLLPRDHLRVGDELSEEFSKYFVQMQRLCKFQENANEIRAYALGRVQ